MKLSWIFVLLLLGIVAVFSVQNAGVITVRFIVWEAALSSALVIQLAALCGAIVGLIIGVRSRRNRPQEQNPAPIVHASPPARNE